MTEKSPSLGAPFSALLPARIEAPIWDAPALLRFWHLASLDAPTVAAVWAVAFAWAVDVQVQGGILLLLGLAVWTVYVADRLLDARKAHRKRQFGNLRDRHCFHWRHRRLLTSLASVAALAAACLAAMLLPAAARAPDALVGIVAVFYFAGVHSGSGLAPQERAVTVPMVSKELRVGALFAAGCALPAWSGSLGDRLGLLPATAFFAALAWLNCSAIARWESEAAGRDVFRAALWLGLLGTAAGAVACAADPRLSALLWAGAAAAMLLAWLDRVRGRLTPIALRALADLMLLTPLALLLQGRL